jgi:non-ribosomal peptide synthase protein (TIGR01720 family)
VAGLALRLAQATSLVDQGPVSGGSPLSASQAWFFRHYRGNRNHFNQSVLLRARGLIDDVSLRTALSLLVRHHDALRLRIVKRGDQIWQEFQSGPNKGLPEIVDLSDVPDGAELEASILEHANRVQRGLDIDAGRMIAAALFKGRERDHLLIVIHHLAVDAVTWRFLLQDLANALAATARNEPVKLSPKTHSFKVWAEQSALASASTTLRAERAFWDGITDGITLATPGPVKRRGTLSLTLTSAETTDVVAAAKGGAGVETMLLAAFARAWADHHQGAPLVVMLEGHGREALVDGIDVNRTAGWFTSMYPIRLDLAGLSDADALRRSAHALRDVPNRGIGFGLLGMSGDLDHGGANLAFNYLGEVDGGFTSDHFEPTLDSVGDMIDPDSQGLHAVDILARLYNGALMVTVSHDPNWLTSRAADALVTAFKGALLKMPAAAAAVVPPARPPIRPYRQLVPEDEPLALNDGRGRPVFAMPPLFGYGSAFRGLAERMPETAFRAFDFIEEADRIERYVRAIQRESAGGAPVLLGYSGGGNLAFAVTKALEAEGGRVAALILLDAPLKRRATVQSSDEIKLTMTKNLNYFKIRMEKDRDYQIYLKDPNIKELMLRKMEAFIRYLDDHIDDGRVKSDIHLLRSSQIWGQPEDWDGWALRTEGRLHRHQGVGEHADMTDQGYIDVNARIIADIIHNSEID